MKANEGQDEFYTLLLKLKETAVNTYVHGGSLQRC
jgi:hypothetical protein